MSKKLYQPGGLQTGPMDRSSTHYHNEAMSQALRKANGSISGSTKERQTSSLTITAALTSEPRSRVTSDREGCRDRHLATRMALSNLHGHPLQARTVTSEYSNCTSLSCVCGLALWRFLAASSSFLDALTSPQGCGSHLSKSGVKLV